MDGSREDPDPRSRFHPWMVQNALRILEHEDAVLKRDPDHWDVLRIGKPGRRAKVHRSGDFLRCAADGYKQDNPCAHIFVVMVYEGMEELPNTAASVFQKGKQGRNHSLETRAWEQVPTQVPVLLARLLGEGLPILFPEPPPDPCGGRPRKPLHSLLYQAVLRVAFRQSLRKPRNPVREGGGGRGFTNAAPRASTVK